MSSNTKSEEYIKKANENYSFETKYKPDKVTGKIEESKDKKI